MPQSSRPSRAWLGAARRAAFVCFALVAWRRADGQTLTCPGAPSPSTGLDCAVRSHSDTALLVVRLASGTAAVAGKPVSLSSKRARALDTLVITDRDGLALATWVGRDSTSVDTVRATFTSGTQRQTAWILIQPPPIVTHARVRVLAGNEQHWYQGQQLLGALEVAVDSVDRATCQNTAISFKAVGDGASSPDSVPGTWSDTAPNCTAMSWWKLGSAVGNQHLRATFPGASSPPAEFHASARGLPWLAAGLALTRIPGFDKAVAKADTIRVTRLTPTGQIQFDSLVSRPSSQRVNPRGVFDPIIGVNFPLWYTWDWARVSLAASATSPTSDWFGGISLTQLLYGIGNEAVATDVQLVIHVSRQSSTRDPTACIASGQCGSRITTLVGEGLAFEVNGSSLLSTLLSAFGK